MEPVRVIYLDSWVWLEYGFEDDLWHDAEQLLRTARDDGGVVSTAGLTEVDYVLARDVDRETADLVTSAMSDLVTVVPVTEEIALSASELRAKYDRRGERELSYGDAIHLATAVLTDCDRLHTGDADFTDVEELPTTVHRDE